MIKLAKPYIGNDELQEIGKVLDSGYLVQGDRVEEFEQMVMEYLDVKHAIAVSSGTAALHLALLALDIKPGDEVIVPDFTFPATANVVELIGATTRFVDVRIDSLCIDENKIEQVITKNTKAIIPVHEFGQAADMNKIVEIAQRYNLKIIEDAACALGAEYKNKKVGTIGDIGCFSFHPRKAITTGEGGVIVTNNDDVAEKIRVLMNHGIEYVNKKPSFVVPGFNYRMTNIQGAIGAVQMKKLEEIIAKRIELAELYNSELKDIKGITLPDKMQYGRHVYQSYHIIVNQDINRDRMIVRLREMGIETNYGAYAVHEQPYYNVKYGYHNENFVNSLRAHHCGVVLPMHMGVDIPTVKYIRNSLISAIQ